jgi:hypothetical protein
MDLNVNFQGLKHNFKKVQGCFCKISRADKFSIFIEYLLIEKGQINLGHWFFLGCSDFNENEGVSSF